MECVKPAGDSYMLLEAGYAAVNNGVRGCMQSANSQLLLQAPVKKTQFVFLHVSHG